MIHSMTAFARVERQLDSGIFCWEIKSVNHRYLDVSFRLPDSFRFLENSFRTMMRGKLSRGKLECQLKFQHNSVLNNQPIVINENLVNGLINASNQLATKCHLTNDLSLTSILNWPDVVQLTQPDVETLGQHAEELFQEAIAQLLEKRNDEGLLLKGHLQNRIERLNLEIERAKQYTGSYAERARDKLLVRLNALQVGVDNARFEQEIALMLTRLDVSEELDRLQAHIIEVTKALETREAAGRRLDFLMQELNREANTLGSKSDSVALTQSAVEMKVLIEQMREQIQNIE